MYWVFIIFFLPAIGAITYVIVELLPEWSNSFTARRTLKGVKRTLDPGAGLRQRKQQHRLSGSVDATRHLASELTDRGRYAEAILHYEAALTGLYEHDPVLLLGLAEAQFGGEQYEKAKSTLERLNEQNPDYRSPEGHLLYARALQECGDLDSAEHEYKAVSAYFAGAEARLRYAKLLEQLDKKDEALEQYEDIAATAEIAPRHYRKAQRRWIAEANDGVRRLKV